MAKTSLHRAVIAALMLAGVGLLVPTVARLAADSTVIEACVNPGNGNLRLVDSGEACHNTETRVEWNVTGPPGPPGPQGSPGPQGPPGTSAGGPPFTWICTPAHYPSTGSNTAADLYVFNGGSSTANVSVNILNKDGANLAGETIPGTAPAANYPGQTGAATVPVAPSATLIVSWQLPQTFTAPAPTPDPTKISTTVRVVSDQPIAVGSNFQFSGFIPLPCSLLPK
ncbi:MAG TPA: hypothetical protein VFT48_20035 [Pyrinomonadaceae bacterium]|nr:hypothetical protein [Pyrinomonadaceae bacterium]